MKLSRKYILQKYLNLINLLFIDLYEVIILLRLIYFMGQTLRKHLFGKRKFLVCLVDRGRLFYIFRRFYSLLISVFLKPLAAHFEDSSKPTKSRPKLFFFSPSAFFFLLWLYLLGFSIFSFSFWLWFCVAGSKAKCGVNSTCFSSLRPHWILLFLLLFGFSFLFRILFVVRLAPLFYGILFMPMHCNAPACILFDVLYFYDLEMLGTAKVENVLDFLSRMDET